MHVVFITYLFCIAIKHYLTKEQCDAWHLGQKFFAALSSHTSTCMSTTMYFNL